MRLPDLPVQVSIRSDVASEMRILSLEDDLTRLVEVFLKHPSSVSKETRTDTSSDSEPDQDIEVTIHLKLAEDAKAHLVEQIKLFVRTLFAEETQT